VADQREADAGAAATAPQAAGADVDANARDDVRAADLAPLPPEQLLNLSIRYKQPDGDTSSLLTFAVKDEDVSPASASADFRFAAAVAEFGMLLRRSPYRGNASYANVLDLAEGALGEDRDGYRRQFMELVRAAQARDSD
jgi:Ca-activated chloride channel family protein